VGNAVGGIRCGGVHRDVLLEVTSDSFDFSIGGWLVHEPCPGWERAMRVPSRYANEIIGIRACAHGLGRARLRHKGRGGADTP